MKYVLVSCVLLAMSFNAFAQDEMSSEASAEIRTEAPATPKLPRTLKGIFGLGLSSARTLSFDESKVTTQRGSTFNGNSKFGMERNFALELGVQQIPADGWGYSALVSYESRIRFTNYEETYGRTRIKGDYKNQPDLDLVTVAANAVYGSGKIYIPFGLNATVPTYSWAASQSKTKPGLGFQVGVGTNALENLAVELNYQSKSFQLKEAFDNGDKYSYGDGVIEGFGLQARMLF